MDPKLIYAKTPTGDEAVRQSTRVVQRNLRMVLVQVDGKLSVEELAAKIGNPRLVEKALRELEEGGFIAPTAEAVSVWEESKRQAKKVQVSALSQFSTFGPRSVNPADMDPAASVASNFSSFGKPILPSTRSRASEPPAIEAGPEPEAPPAADRRQVPWLKLGLGGLAAIVALSLATLLLYPYDRLKPGLEAAAGRLLEAPVRIGQVNLALLPRPQLRLTDVRIGEPADAHIDEIRLDSPLSLLTGSQRPISGVGIAGGGLSTQRLLALPILKPPAVPGGVGLRQLRVENLQVSAGDLVLRDISGEIRYQADGTVEKAQFQAVDRSLRIDAIPTAQGILLAIEGLGWKPAGMQVSFESLQARGLLKKDRLLIHNLDTTFLGGIVKGNWLLDWSNGLVMAGDGTLSRLDCRKVSAAFAPLLKLEGDLGGVIRLRAAGKDWDGMWQNLEGVLDAEVTRGVLHGVDLGEAARRGGGAVVRAGATKFDRLHAALTLDPRQLTARDVQMDAGMVKASGQFVASRDNRVEGALTVSMQTSVSSLRVPVRISGSLPELSVIGGK